MQYNEYFLLLNRIFLVLITGLTFWLGIWVYSSNPKEKSNRIFALMAFSFLFWWSGGYLFTFSNNLDFALLFGRILLAVVSISFGLMYYFMTVFPYEKRNSIIDKLMLICSTVFFILPLSGDLIVEGVKFTPHGIDPIYGRAQIIYYLWIALAMIIIITHLIRKYIETPQKVRFKIQYLLLGFGIFIIMNLAFNVVLPVVRGSIEYWQFGNYSAMFLLSLAAYAIVKERLFGIKILLTSTLISLIAVVLALDLFAFTDKFWLQIVKAFVLVIFAVMGRWLIRSVLMEIEQREQIQKLAKDLEKANDHLEELDKLKDNFMSMASHELNTPIAAIEGYLSMILDEGIGEKIGPTTKKYLDSVYKSSRRLAALVKDLLNVSRIESNRIHIMYDEAQIEDVIDQSIMEINSKAEEVNHKITFDKPKTPMPKTWFDVARITEVLINILGNAIKYTDPGGKIDVKVSRDEKFIQVAIEDNGRGIPRSKHDTVFQKFSQVDVLKDQVKGTGLGMYISKNLIELQKGKIWFESEGTGKGTTFFFTLPILSKKPFDEHSDEGAVLKLSEN